MMDDNELFEKAIQKKSEDNQVNQAIEELNELAVALNHYRRTDRAPRILDVIEEIADAELGIAEMKYLWKIPESAIREMKIVKKEKLERSLL